METLVSKIIEQELQKMAPFRMIKTVQICSKHGEYDAYPVLRHEDTLTSCPKCMDEKNEIERIAKHEQWMIERNEKIWADKLGRAAIPERFKDRRLENYIASCQKSKKALLVAQEYSKNFDDVMKAGSSLIFCGGVGTGKTHLAVGIANEIMLAGKQAVFTSVMRAVRSVKETYSRNSEISEADAIKDMVTPDLLILDEVGVQFGSDTEKLILFEIINGRYESIRPTIVISNLAAAALESFLGARSFDRLREGGGKLVIFDWSSYRSKA